MFGRNVADPVVADQAQANPFAGIFAMFGISIEQQEQFAKTAKWVFERFVDIEKRTAELEKLAHANQLQLTRIEAKLDAAVEHFSQSSKSE